jgi:hypothetical protein
MQLHLLRTEIINFRNYWIIRIILINCLNVCDSQNLDKHIESLSFEHLYDLHHFDELIVAYWSIEYRQVHGIVLVRTFMSFTLFGLICLVSVINKMYMRYESVMLRNLYFISIILNSLLYHRDQHISEKRRTAVLLEFLHHLHDLDDLVLSLCSRKFRQTYEIVLSGTFHMMGMIPTGLYYRCGG